MSSNALLVHENPAIRTLLGVRLEAAGFHAIVVGDGLRGIQAIRDLRPTLALIDLSSPAPGAVQLVRVLSRMADPDLEVCVIADEGDAASLRGLPGIRWLTRGQVYHPGFTTALREKFAGGVRYAEVHAQPFFLDV